MSTMKKMTALLIVLMLCLQMVVPAYAANDIGITYTATIDTPVINESDAAQTVVVTVSANMDVDLDGIQASVEIPDGFKVSSVKCGSPLMTFDYANGIASSNFNYEDEEGNWIDYITVRDLIVITYTVPAGAEAGKYKLGVSLDEITIDFGEVWEDGSEAYATLEIKEASSEPECDHADAEAKPNNDGTHNVVCECGETVEENVPCSGGSATCTAKAKCSECGAEYGDFGAHTYGALIPAQAEVHTENELKAAVAAHYLCECGKYFTEGKVETTLDALTGETPVHTEDPSKTTTVTDPSASCTEEGKTVTETFCSCGKLLDRTETTIDPVGHTWGTVIDYSWTGTTHCTATRTCETDENHKETVEAVVTRDVTTEGTCQTAEVETYTATFDVDWAEDQTKEVIGEKDMTNHIGDAVISYRDNENGTHTAVSTYECGHSVDGETAPCSDGDDEDELCDSCGNDLHVCAHDHYYTTDDTHQSICSCGKPIGEAEACSGGTATCKDYAVCKVCGEEYGELSSEHTGQPIVEYGNSLNHEINCSDCGETFDEENPTAPHVANENGYCVCGAFEVVQDFNGGKISETSPDPTLTDEQWREFVEALLGGFDAESLTQFATVEDEIMMPLVPEYFESLNLQFVREGYKIVALAYDAEGNDLYQGEFITGPCTIYLIWESTHVCTPAEYIDNLDGTHTVKCACGETLVAEPHDFDNCAHTCYCGAVETFTLNVNILATGDLVKLTVPYGANLLEVLEKAADEGKIPAIGDQIRMNNASYNGYVRTIGYSYWDEEAEDFIYDLEGLTMPADDFAVDQDHSFYNGWDFHYDENDEYRGAAFLSEEGYLTGWNFIEEDYDDVEGGAWYYFYEDTGNWEGWFFRAEGLTRAPYPTEEINGNTYTPDAETLEYCADKGIEFIDADEAWFLFAEGGKFKSDFTGIIPSEGDSSYAVNGMLTWHPGMVEGEDEYYYFIGDEDKGGNTMASGDVYVQRNNTDRDFVIGGIYTFDIYGVLCEYDGIIDMDNGTKRYYEDAQLMIGNGLTKVDENFIYVRSNGELVVNNEYYIPAGNAYHVVSGHYEFDENGFMVDPVISEKEGIVAENGGLYFYENGKIAYNKGLIAYNGGLIYVRSNGQLAVGEYYITNVANYTGTEYKTGDKLTFGADGYLVAAKNGIVDGYFYKDNKIVYGAGVVEYNGGYIYVKSDGTVVMGKNYWITNVGDTGVVAKLYTFDANGFFTPEFAEDAKEGIVDGYFYENGAIAYGKGLIEYNGGYIYVRSNGQVATGKYWITNTNGLMENGYYTFGEDGMMIN